MRTAATIIEQLDDVHAEMTATGLGGPAVDDFHNLCVELIAEADDPEYRLREIADLITSRRAETAKSA